MIEAGKTYVVMGLLDPDSIAYAVGKGIEALGGEVVFTMQNERMRRIFMGRTKKITEEEKAALPIRYADVTVDEEVKTLFDGIGPIAGVVHSIAFSNPKTCLGPDFHTDAIDDVLAGFHISAASLATVAKHAQPHMAGGGGIVALSFGAMLAYPYYNWMGVNKAALEAVVRGLARRHGRDLVRVNAVSAGAGGDQGGQRHSRIRHAERNLAAAQPAALGPGGCGDRHRRFGDLPARQPLPQDHRPGALRGRRGLRHRRRNAAARTAAVMANGSCAASRFSGRWLRSRRGRRRRC